MFLLLIKLSASSPWLYLSLLVAGGLLMEIGASWLLVTAYGLWDGDFDNRATCQEAWQIEIVGWIV